MQRNKKFFIALLLGVLILSAARRVAIIIKPFEVTGDAIARYHPIAVNLTKGRGFSKETTQPFITDDFDMPGYPAMVAVIYYLSNFNLSVLVAFQFFLEILMLLICAAIARELGFGRRAQIAVFIIGFLFPVLPVFAGEVYTEVTATLFSALTCFLCIRAVKTQAIRFWLAAGIAAGIGVEMRPDMLSSALFYFVGAGICLLLKYFKSSLPIYGKRGLILPVIYILGLCGCMSVWTIRNYQTFGEFRPIGRVTEQSRYAYSLWLNTWLYDFEDYEIYWWRSIDPTATAVLPDKDINRKADAENALILVKQRGTINDKETADKFSELATSAKQETFFHSVLVVPLRRLFSSILHFPMYIGKKLIRVITHIFWISLLTCAALGAVKLVRFREFLVIILLAGIFSRIILPLQSAVASEPRYLIECLPVCFVLAGIFLYPQRNL